MKCKYCNKELYGQQQAEDHTCIEMENAIYGKEPRTQDEVNYE